MGPAFFSFVHEDETDSQVIGAIAYRPQEKNRHSSLLQEEQLLVIVVCDTPSEEEVSTEHYSNHSTQYQILYVAREQIERWIITGQQQELMHYFLHGEMIWDVHGQLALFHEQVVSLSDKWQALRKLREFSQLVYFYFQAKQGEERQVLMDTYYNLLHALKHYAAIELIEMSGELPSVHVWDQVSGMNATSYKLFEELVNSTETLNERIQLALIAIEFSVTSRMSECSRPLLKILDQKKTGWTMEELMRHNELQYMKEHLPTLVHLLVQRAVVYQESFNTKKFRHTEQEIKYKVNPRIG